MNTKDEILAQLRARRPFREIRTEVNLISKLYEAGGQYLDELGADLQGKRIEISKLEEGKSALEAQVEVLRIEIESRKEENRKLEQENARLKNEVSDRTTDLNSVQAETDRFREQGFTSEIMQKLELLLERGGPTLLEQVESVEKYHKAMKEYSVLNPVMLMVMEK